ncbi:MAG: hypothetical protein JOZ96_14250 [Acidobacteria bacterium]|nr:hypothetical protein [Acidobacteriota bacterium]
MRERLTVLAGILVLFGAVCIALGSLPSNATTAQPATAKASPDRAAAHRQTGYCQINGCINLPPDGFCPSGYYRFQGSACCCPIRRTRAGEVAGLDTRRRPDIPLFLPGSLPDIAPALYGARCGS